MSADVKQLKAPGATTGHVLTVQADGTIAPAAGGGGGSAVPTPGSWGATTQTSGGTLTLVDADDTVQILEGPDKVELPAEASTNPFFVLINNGGATVEIELDSASSAYLEPGETAQVYSNGSDQWYVSSPAAATVTGDHILWFAFNHANQAYRFEAMQYNAASASYVAWGVPNQFSMPAPGRLTGIGGAWAIGNRTPQYQIYKNGALSETATDGTLSALYTAISGLTTEFAQNDKIGLLCLNPTLGATRATIEADIRGPAAVLDWTNLGTTAGYFAYVNVQAHAAAFQTYYQSFVMPVAGMRLTALNWYHTTSSVCEHQIWKNGVLSGSAWTTLELSGKVEVPTIYLAQGDYLALKLRVSGTPGECHIQYLLEGVRARFYRWGNHLSSPGNAYYAYGSPGLFTGISRDYRTSAYPVRSGTVIAAGGANRDARGSLLRLYKNGVFSENIPGSLAAGTWTGTLNTAVAARDAIDILAGASGGTGYYSNTILAIR